MPICSCGCGKELSGRAEKWLNDSHKNEFNTRVRRMAIQSVLARAVSIDITPLPLFDGRTYEDKHDRARLESQLVRIFDLMKDGNWRTLREISAIVHGSESGVSARLRDMRKPKFGGHTVERRARGDRERGLFEYKLIVKIEAA